MKEWHRVADTAKWTASRGAPPERVVESFYNHPLYIHGLVENIGRILRQFPDSSRISSDLSARNGLRNEPDRKSGDPYPHQIEATVRLTCRKRRPTIPELAAHTPPLLSKPGRPR